MQLEAPHYRSMRQYAGVFRISGERHSKLLRQKINSIISVGSVLSIATAALFILGNSAIHLVAACGLLISAVLMIGLKTLLLHVKSREATDARVMDNISKIQDYEADTLMRFPDAQSGAINIPVALLNPIYSEIRLDEDFGLDKVSVYSHEGVKLMVSLFANEYTLISESNSNQDEIQFFMDGLTKAQ